MTAPARTLTAADFVLARLAEDEAAARAAAEVESPNWWVDGPAQVTGKWWVYATGEKFKHEATADHIARHDPARVLAQCEALRAMVEWDAEQYVGYGVVEKLAAIWRDHPAFDPSWAAS